MSKTAEQLEKLHKQICAAVSPLTFMLAKRRYSPTVLRMMVANLKEFIEEVEKFLEE